MGIGDWGLGIGDWGLGQSPNPQSPIPNPQSPILFWNDYKELNNLFKDGNDVDLLFLRFNKLRNGTIGFEEILDEIEPIF